MALLLSDWDVRSLLTMKEALTIVEELFREKGMGKVQMPPKTYLFFTDYEGDLRVMPAFIPGWGAAGVKIVNSHPLNFEKYGLPAVSGTVILVDPRNGFPKAIIGANTLTSMRTGAAGGVAAKYLARENSEVVGMIGTGVQARAQLQALLEVLPRIARAKVYDLDRGRATGFAKDFSVRHDLAIEVVGSAERAVRSIDVLVTTTPSRTPVVRRAWVEPGTHINAIGSDAPGKQELETEILLESKVVPDDWDQAAHGGEVNVAVSKGIFTRSMIHGELGEIVCGRIPGRESEEEITVFDSTGLAIQDVGVAGYLYDRALSAGKGTEIEIWR